MNVKRWSLAIVILLSFSCFAWGQPQETPKSSTVENVLLSILPIVLIAGFIWVFFIRTLRKLQTSQVEEQRQYRQNIEKLLERIAKALEEKRSP